MYQPHLSQPLASQHEHRVSLSHPSHRKPILIFGAIGISQLVGNKIGEIEPSGLERGAIMHSGAV
jgi:hypothetical protein